MRIALDELRRASEIVLELTRYEFQNLAMIEARERLYGAIRAARRIADGRRRSPPSGPHPGAS